jgi:hypothetical protein
MFNAKSLCEEVKSLKGRLEGLELQEHGRKIGELQKASREFERVHRTAAGELQQAYHKLAVRLATLQGVAVVLFAVLSGVAVYYIDRYQTEAERKRLAVEQHRQTEEGSHEVLIDFFQDKFGDTLDRISLFAPTEEDRTMVTELDELRQKLSRLVGASEKFGALSELTNALKLIVNEGKGEEASAQLDKKALAVSRNRFIASRALLLQAMTLIQAADRVCNDPERIQGLLNGAIQRDSRVTAAFNLLGVCLAEESRALMSERPDEWQRSGELIQAALRNNELAYQFTPTQWSRARLLNNRVWEKSEFLLAALTQNRLNESLPWTGNKTMQEFFSQSVSDIEECQMLDPRQASYMETLAELHGLECAFYRSPYHKDDLKAEEAYEKMRQALTGAINKGLLRKMSGPGEAERYFNDDSLLAPLFADPEIPATLDPSIKALIERRTRSQGRF